MAIYNLEVKTGLKGNGLRHAQYIERDDTYCLLILLLMKVPNAMMNTLPDRTNMHTNQT